MLVRLGFHELKRVQLGWFRNEAEVRAIAEADLAHQDKMLKAAGDVDTGTVTPGSGPSQ